MPDNGTRGAWINDIAAIPAGRIPARLREAVGALLPISGGAVAEQIEALAVTWSETPPDVVVLPKKRAAPKAVAAPKIPGSPRVAAVKAPKVVKVPKTPRTPAAQIDPRRAEWVRDDAVTRLNASEYSERGLKESIFLGGIKHRSPYKDMTDEEIKVTLRKLDCAS